MKCNNLGHGTRFSHMTLSMSVPKENYQLRVISVAKSTENNNLKRRSKTKNNKLKRRFNTKNNNLNRIERCKDFTLLRLDRDYSYFHIFEQFILKNRAIFFLSIFEKSFLKYNWGRIRSDQSEIQFKYFILRTDSEM